MAIFWGKIVTWLAAGVLTVWTAKKTLLLVTFISFLSVALYGVFLYGVQDIFNSVLGYVGDVDAPGSSPALSNFTGFAGWLLSCFKLPECLAFIVEIIILKWTLRKIPIIKW